MRYSKYIISIFLLFSCLAGFSQTYTVTSLADSGPGTLRQGLLSVPAGTPGFVIDFNLPGDPSDHANRTIRLRSQLPIVPSNVTIDGSTQASWPALGVSGAKVIIEPETPATANFNALVIGQLYSDNSFTSGVQIYGLYIRNFARINSFQTAVGGSGIVIDYRANNIKIGAPGKGNVISGNINGINIQNSNYYSYTSLINITILSNLIGVLYDGISPQSNVVGISANLYDCSLNIGGDNTGDGNVISANQTNVNIIRNGYSNAVNRFEINIVNNKIGTDYTGTKDFHELPLFKASSTQEISGVKINSTNTQLYMRKNVISGNRTIGVSIMNADFILTGNAIGTGTAGTETLGNGVGIKIEQGATGIIGGANPDDKNLIGYNEYGIESVSSKPVKITRNSMFCNKVISIGKAANNYQPFVQILKKRPGHISGRATPNSEVELFYTINCEGLCEGRTYYRTVQAGSDGRWVDDQAVSANVTATASLLNATTSQFSTAALLSNEEVLEHVTCNRNGSIRILEPREGFIFTWNKILDNRREFLSNEQFIEDLAVGTYELILDDGCLPVRHVFDIKDQKLTDIVPTSTPSPACGQSGFTFAVSVLRGSGAVKFEWRNASGGLVSTTTNANNISSVPLPQGTYTVTATDAAGCTKSYSFQEVKRKPSPIVRILNQITAAACGKENGAITGIDVQDATNPTFKWYTYNNVTNIRGTTPISEERELKNFAGGYYVLVVSDDGGCPPVATSPILIPIYDSVKINAPQTIRPATCNSDNGAATGITILEADTYELLTLTGLSIRKGNYAVGDVLSFPGLAPGTYRITATNSVTGCNKTEQIIINKIDPTQYEFTASPLPTTCGDINGSITIRFANGTPRPVSYQWTDAAGNPVPGATYTNTTTLSLPKLPGGTYTMVAYDVNGCTVTFGPYRVEETEVLSVNNTSIPPTNDGCSLSRGAITGLTARGGILPYAYQWHKEDGTKFGSNQLTPDLLNAPAGKYYVVVKDATPCGDARSDLYTIENPSFPVAAPVVNSLISVCYATEITIKVKAPEEGTYQLFREITDAAPIMESVNGLFVFKVSKTGDYVIRRKLGTCFSDFTPIHVEVTNDNLDIRNTMTPNGDGKNDYWMITGLPDHDINIKVYTRSGQLVYESSKRYDIPFDGRFRGKELPAGAYYYKIDLRSDCNPIGGSITLLR